MEPPILQGAPQGSGAGLIKDTSTQTFKADVIDASFEALVLVDFWAPWCGPCKQLTPVLEKAVKDAGGTVRLVKLDIDQHPAIPGQMGIQSIPAVFAFKDGRPVDAFMGALPESQVKEFIARHAEPAGKAAADGALAQAQAAFEAGDASLAAQIFAEIVQTDSENAAALAGLARCYLETGDTERAGQTLALWDAGGKAAPEIDAVRAALELARKAEETGGVAELGARVGRDPDDFQARCDLAITLNARGDRDGAAAQLLAIIARKRDWNDGAARAQLLQLFEAWGDDDPATLAGRQKLSSLLFA